MIGMVGFGTDFKASRNIDDTTHNTFALLTTFLKEAVTRSGNPFRKYSRCKVNCKQTASNHRLQTALIHVEAMPRHLHEFWITK